MCSPYVRIRLKVYWSLEHKQTDVELDSSLASPDEESRMRSGLSPHHLAHECPALSLVLNVVLSEYNCDIIIHVLNVSVI